MSDILQQIIDKRRSDIDRLGLTFGIEISSERTRAVHPFLVSKGVILEVKRASPSKGDIACDLDPAATAVNYSKS
ncbi:MAG: bifunctional indole-3-glycerol phosphate synthase/phosphoribosylanthranilate isomerase, partial [Treponema sp.]|nr:bifunctional indole-3-glycerol phosphate synthase/phosphoribosylanthranilate isomerase [Treponema sp.]